MRADLQAPLSSVLVRVRPRVLEGPGLGAALLACAALIGCAAPRPSHHLAEPEAPRAVLVLHGGAGTIDRASMTPELEQDYRAALEGALRAGHAVLAGGGNAMDAVEATLLPLEDSPLFNAGRGAVLTADRLCELDASVMDGGTGLAGAVAGIRTVRHPIRAARAVMEKSEHVLLAGRGADAFAAEQGLELVDNAWFQTERRVRQLDQALADAKFGTVGCVALDEEGHLAAGTTTGGMTAKRYGRVGDSPLIGAGTWAEDGVCGVSATGWGEFFIRGAVASTIAARMRFGGASLADAASATIHGDLTARGGTGGVVALDAEGRVAAPFNTPGMYRGWITAEGDVTVRIWSDR